MRQLVQAQAVIHDLRTKPHHARLDKGAAHEAARLANAAKVNAERTLIATESALATEKAPPDSLGRLLRMPRRRSEGPSGDAGGSRRRIGLLSVRKSGDRPSGSVEWRRRSRRSLPNQWKFDRDFCPLPRANSQGASNLLGQAIDNAQSQSLLSRSLIFQRRFAGSIISDSQRCVPIR